VSGLSSLDVRGSLARFTPRVCGASAAHLGRDSCGAWAGNPPDVRLPPVPYSATAALGRGGAGAGPNRESLFLTAFLTLLRVVTSAVGCTSVVWS